MTFIRRLGKWALVLYVAQALVGIGVGVYLAVTLDPAEIERMVSCVAH
jgi:hypothetical protein